INFHWIERIKLVGTKAAWMLSNKTRTGECNKIKLKARNDRQTGELRVREIGADDKCAHNTTHTGQMGEGRKTPAWCMHAPPRMDPLKPGPNYCSSQRLSNQIVGPGIEMDQRIRSNQ